MNIDLLFFLLGLLMLLPLAIALGIIPLLVLRALRTRVSLKQGRFQIREGVIGSRVHSFEIWRATKIELKQTFLQALTNDGYLEITLTTGETVLVPGISSFDQLSKLQQNLLNLSLLLRQNPAFKVIHQ